MSFARPLAAQDLPKLEIAPVTIDLTPGTPGLFYIADRGTASVTVQLQAFQWNQDDGIDRLTPTDALTVSPPMTTIAPGERQIVRILADAGGDGHEGTYRLLVSQIPAAVQPHDSVRVLMQVNVPVFVSTGDSQNAKLSWSARRDGSALVIAAHNAGGRAAKLSGLSASGAGFGPRRVSDGRIGYVLPGAERIWRVSNIPLSATQISITGRDVRAGADVSADIAIAR